MQADRKSRSRRPGLPPFSVAIDPHTDDDVTRARYRRIRQGNDIPQKATDVVFPIRFPTELHTVSGLRRPENFQQTLHQRQILNDYVDFEREPIVISYRRNLPCSLPGAGTRLEPGRTST